MDFRLTHKKKNWDREFVLQSLCANTAKINRNKRQLRVYLQFLQNTFLIRNYFISNKERLLTYSRN